VDDTAQKSLAGEYVITGKSVPDEFRDERALERFQREAPGLAARAPRQNTRASCCSRLGRRPSDYPALRAFSRNDGSDPEVSPARSPLPRPHPRHHVSRRKFSRAPPHERGGFPAFPCEPELQPSPDVDCHYFFYTQRPEDRILKAPARYKRHVRLRYPSPASRHTRSFHPRRRQAAGRRVPGNRPSRISAPNDDRELKEPRLQRARADRLVSLDRSEYTTDEPL
jgi:hypothetical protein